MASNEIARMFVTISADSSPLTQELERSKTALNGFKTGFADLQNVASASLKVISGAATLLGGAIAKTGIEFNAMKEQANVAFTTMLGSGQLAKDFLDELQEFAAKTPFEFPDLVRASQRLLAMGFAAGEVKPLLTSVGDAVAALGGGAYEIDRVTLALGQMKARGKTTAEEMMQLTEVGIPAWQMLADAIGVDVGQAMEMVTKGAVTADTTISAVVAGINQRFGGMMEKQSQTWNGLLSTLRDVFGQISGTVMEPFFAKAKELLASTVTAMTSFHTHLKNGLTVWGALKVAVAEVLPENLRAGWVKFVDTLSNATRVIQSLFVEVKSFEDDTPMMQWLLQFTDGVRQTIARVAEAIGKFVSWKDVAITVGVVLASVAASIIASMMPMIATFAAITAAVAGLRWAWQNDFAGIQAFTRNTLNKISQWFYNESGIWKGDWEETFAFIADRVRYFFQYQIYNFIVGNWANIKEKWRFHTTKIRDMTVTWVNELIQTITNWKDRTLETINYWKNTAISRFNNFFGPIKKDFTDWATVTLSTLERWKDWGVKYFEEWKGKVVGLFEKVTGWWDTHIQPFIDRGREIAQGLWDGVKERWDQFTGWWERAWESLERKFKNFFGIHSPSTLFAGFGNDMVTGLAMGIDAASGKVYSAMDILGAGMNKTLMGMTMAPEGVFAPFVSLQEALGEKKAEETLSMLRDFASDADVALRKFGIKDMAILGHAFNLSDMAAAGSTASIGDLDSAIEALISQMNNVGLGSGATSQLGGASEYLSWLMTGNSGLSTPSAPTSSGGGMSDEVGRAIIDMLKIIADALLRNGKVNHEDLSVVRAYLSNIYAGGTSVNNMAGLAR